MTCGIYKIENKINGKLYIGQSINIEERWKNHKTHYKINDEPLYNEMKLYGIEKAVVIKTLQDSSQYMRIYMF